MKYFFALLGVGGIVCAVNIIIIQFFKNRFPVHSEPWEEDDLRLLREGFDKELKEFRSLIEENVEEARKERLLLEEARRETEALRQECRQHLEKLEDIMEKKMAVCPEPGSFPLPHQDRARRHEKMHSLLRQGLSLETVAQRLQMGLGEARLRLALSEKEENGYENRP